MMDTLSCPPFIIFRVYHIVTELTTMADLNKGWSVGGEGAMEDKDFDEEDVWSVTKEKDDSGHKNSRACRDCCDSSSAWRLLAAPRNIPRANTTIASASDAFLLVKGSSAPMGIPDWSKIYGKNYKQGSKNDGSRSNKSDDDEDDDDMVPPHEWIAKKLARSHISSFSVCEGMGRTLKGRDLSKVRNTILTKTGFIE